jgi:phospholipase C
MRKHQVESVCRPLRAVSRRHFLRTSAAVAAGMFAMPVLAEQALATKRSRLPPPEFSGIEHIIVVTMEGRSFDHFLGWLPNADGRQEGLSYLDRDGNLQPTFSLAPDFQGGSHPVPDHSYQGGRKQYNEGACNGWLRIENNDRYAIGYYGRRALAFLGNAAPAWTTCDRYFASIMAETYPNRIYQYAAQTDRLTDSTELCSLPTVLDRLAEHQIEGRYYFSDVPFLALWGPKYVSVTRTFNHFLEDCANGSLPQVSFVDPRLLGEKLGPSNCDHPHADIRNGQSFLNILYNAVTSSPNWASTVLIINYADSGGFFDHVSPPPAPVSDADKSVGNADGLRGFRVPALIISPWSIRGGVAHGVYDHTSILKMIEWRWRLQPLTIRDATAKNLAEALDFSHASMHAPRFNVPVGPFLNPGSSAYNTSDRRCWQELAVSARRAGYLIS